MNNTQVKLLAAALREDLRQQKRARIEIKRDDLKAVLEVIDAYIAANKEAS